ncbi:ARM repeat-containing protein [Serendipita vermifera]|nr:ARM repeat-containing protein [Serendipita vermifera]
MEYDDVHSKYVAQEMVTILVNNLGHQDLGTQRAVVDVIGRLMKYDGFCSKYVTQEMVTVLVNNLGHRNSNVQRTAVDAIGRLMEYDDTHSKYVTQEMVTVLVNKCGERDPDVKRAAVNIIGKLMQYELPSTVLTTIINKLDDSSHSKQKAAVALRSLADQDNLPIRNIEPKVITALVNMLGHRDQIIQVSSVKILANLSKYGPPLSY